MHLLAKWVAQTVQIFLSNGSRPALRSIRYHVLPRLSPSFKPQFHLNRSLGHWSQPPAKTICVRNFLFNLHPYHLATLPSHPVTMFAFVPIVSLTRPSVFSGARVSSQTAPVAARVSMVMSKSIPYAECPPKLDGTMAGDVGFDPLGFSNKYDLNFLREAELKHGRICMLAMLGWVFPEAVYHLPNEIYSQTNPLYAVGSVGFLPIAQIVLFIIVCEAASYKHVYEDKCKEPGNLGLDVFGILKNPNRKKHYELAEVKNGRLAMVAIGGAIHHALLTNVGLVEQITSGKWFGGYYLH